MYILCKISVFFFYFSLPLYNFVAHTKEEFLCVEDIIKPYFA